MKAAIALSVFAGGANALYSTNESMDAFGQWKNEYSKKYSTLAEEKQAFSIFMANSEIISEHNARGLSYQLGHNAYSDMTADDFIHSRTMAPLNLEPPRREKALLGNEHAPLADDIDWVAKGAVTPVKNQGRCGSCWAFSSTGAIEGSFAINTGTLTSFSEEELVACEKTDHGCHGGLMDHAFTWVEKNGGLCSEASYPYTSGGGQVDQCKSTCNAVGTITDYADVPQGDEDELKAAVAKQPVAIAIQANQAAFHLYKSGVIDGECGLKLDHGVLIVGYGTDASLSKDYWKVKNSWGASWGEQGFVRIVRGKNMCGIAQKASYPTATALKNISPPPPSPPNPPPSPPSPPPPPNPPPLTPFVVIGKEDHSKVSYREWVHTPTFVSDSVMVGAEAMHGLKVYNVSNPALPTVIAEDRDNLYTPQAVLVTSDKKTAYLLQSDHAGHLTSIDISNVSAPKTLLKSTVVRSSRSSNFAKDPKDDNWLFAHDNTMGVVVVNASDRTNPHMSNNRAAWLPPPGATGVPQMSWSKGILYGGPRVAVNVTEPLTPSAVPLGFQSEWGDLIVPSECGCFLVHLGANLTIYNATDFAKGAPLKMIRQVPAGPIGGKHKLKMVWHRDVLYTLIAPNQITAINATKFVQHGVLNFLASTGKVSPFPQMVLDLVVDPKTRNLFVSVQVEGLWTIGAIDPVVA